MLHCRVHLTFLTHVAAAPSIHFSTIATSAAEYDALSEPVYDGRGKPRILFAGEATTRYHPSTVHGAWLTGLREATRLDVHAKAGWHRKGYRSKHDDDDFSPDIMYESSILFGERRPGVKRGPGKVRIRPTKQPDGTDIRRSPRVGVSHSHEEPRNGKRKRGASIEGPASSLRHLPQSESESPVRQRNPVDGGDHLSNASNRRRTLPLGKVVGVSN